MKCSKKKYFSHVILQIRTKHEAGNEQRLTNLTNCQFGNPKKIIFFSSEDLERELNAPVTSRTIRNRLIAKDLWAHSARKVLYLSKTNICNIKIFAKKRLLRENWKNVLWSDETKVNLFGSDGKQYVRRPKNTSHDPKHTIKTI